MLITHRNVAFFLISSMILGLLDQLQTFLRFHLIELLGLLTGLGLLELQHLIYPRLLLGFGMVVFTNLSLMEFQVRYLVLFLLFSVIDSFQWFWMESVHKNIQLMLEFFKVSFLVLYFSYYTFNDLPGDVTCDVAIYADDTTFYFVIRWSGIRHLICGNNLNWLWNLSLINETLWTGTRSSLLFSMLGKLNWFCLGGITALVLLMQKWVVLLLRNNRLLGYRSWPSLLN